MLIWPNPLHCCRSYWQADAAQLQKVELLFCGALRFKQRVTIFLVGAGGTHRPVRQGEMAILARQRGAWCLRFRTPAAALPRRDCAAYSRSMCRQVCGQEHYCCTSYHRGTSLSCAGMDLQSMLVLCMWHVICQPAIHTHSKKCALLLEDCQSDSK